MVQSCMEARGAYTHRVADLASQLRNLIYEVAEGRKRAHPAYFYRETKRLNQAEIARKIGWAVSTVTRLAKGTFNPRHDSMQKLLAWSPYDSMGDLEDALTRAKDHPPGAWKYK